MRWISPGSITAIVLGMWRPIQLDYGTPLAPAGNVHTSLEDLAKFIALQFLHKRPAILNRKQLDELLIPIPGNYGGAARLGCLPPDWRGIGKYLWLLTQGGAGPCCGFFAVCPGSPRPRTRVYGGSQFLGRRRSLQQRDYPACSNLSLIAS